MNTAHFHVYGYKTVNGKKERHPFATVGLTSPDSKTVKVAFAVCSPEDRFERKISTSIVRGRLEKDISITLPNEVQTVEQIDSFFSKELLKRIPHKLQSKIEVDWTTACGIFESVVSDVKVKE
jgi:hypothetical protein